jgi:hypothetical protein
MLAATSSEAYRVVCILQSLYSCENLFCWLSIIYRSGFFLLLLAVLEAASRDIGVLQDKDI